MVTNTDSDVGIDRRTSLFRPRKELRLTNNDDDRSWLLDELSSTTSTVKGVASLRRRRKLSLKREPDDHDSVKSYY